MSILLALDSKAQTEDGFLFMTCWVTRSCVLWAWGFQCCLCSVSGVWPEGSDGTDINAICRAHEKKLLCTGDDFGKVHLFSYPCSQFRVRP